MHSKRHLPVTRYYQVEALKWACHVGSEELKRRLAFSVTVRILA